MTQCPACSAAVEPGGVCEQCGTETAAEQSSGRRQQSRPRGQQTPAGDGRTHRRPRACHRHPLPSGIKLLCGLLVLSGLGSLALGLQLHGLGQAATAYGAAEAGGSLGLAGLLVLVFGAGDLVAAVGLWTRKSWGWTAGLGVAGCGLLTSLLLLTDPFTGTVGMLGLLYSAGVGWYVHGKRWLYRGQSQRATRGRRQPRSQQ